MIKLNSSIAICLISVMSPYLNASMITGGNLSISPTITADSVTLGNDTIGDYVATLDVVVGDGLETSGAATGEGIAHSIGIDQTHSPTWTGAHTFTPSGTNDFSINTDADSSIVVNETVNPTTVPLLFANEFTINNTIGAGESFITYTNTADNNDFWWAGRNNSGTFNFRYNPDNSVNTTFKTVLSLRQTASVCIGGACSVGTNGAGVISLGAGTAPSTQPADSVQFWRQDYAAGDARFYLLTEIGGRLVLGNNAIENNNSDGTLKIASESDILLRLDSDNDSSESYFLIAQGDGTNTFFFSESGNFGLGTASVGTNGTRTISFSKAIAPTTQVADVAQVYSDDFAVDDNRLWILTETGSAVGLGNGAILSAGANLSVASTATGGADTVTLSPGGVAAMTIGEAGVITGNLSFTPASTDDIVFNVDGDSDLTITSGTDTGPIVQTTNAGGFSMIQYINTADAADIWRMGRLPDGRFLLQWGAATSVTDTIMSLTSLGNLWTLISVSLPTCDAGNGGAMITYSKTAATVISKCVCEAVASVYAWTPVTLTGDCT